jgi:Zn-dependent M28 family amino/carboxypeptidase
MLYPGGGHDLIDGGTAAGDAVREDYLLHHYHQPSDEWNANWDLSGIVADLNVLYTVGDQIANSDTWPDWYEGNEFRTIRDKEMAGRK